VKANVKMNHDDHFLMSRERKKWKSMGEKSTKKETKKPKQPKKPK